MTQSPERLDALNSKMEANQSEPLDPALIRALEAQLTALSAHLDRPDPVIAGLADLTPRLERIESAVSDSRDELLETARLAAEEVLRNFAGSPVEAAAIAGLTDDLKALESLTRDADDRNTRTFDAIHETLIKIIDRIGQLDLNEQYALREDAPLALSQPEPEPEKEEEPARAKVDVGQAPSIDMDDMPSMEDESSSFAFNFEPVPTPASVASDDEAIETDAETLVEDRSTRKSCGRRVRAKTPLSVTAVPDKFKRVREWRPFKRPRPVSVMDVRDRLRWMRFRGGFQPSSMASVTGENATSSNSQTLANMLGKILRMNPDGTIPTDNPFYGTATGFNRLIWALGLRNPFTFAVQPGTGTMFINDVGQNTWEEINVGRKGANYGWPTSEGGVPANPSFDAPLYAYNHQASITTPSGCAITGGDFYNPPTATFPASYTGLYFFADLCGGWIYTIHPNTRSVTHFLAGASTPVDIRTGADGKFIKLDETGNAKALAALKASTRDKDLKAKVTGSLDGDVIQVQSVELVP